MQRTEIYNRQIDIPSGNKVTVKESGNIIEVVYVNKRNEGAQILKIDKEHYIRLNDDTGEVLTFSHGESRMDDIQSVKKTLERIRDYINTNVVDTKKCKWLTLTYKENMRDVERLGKDFEAFNRRCRKRYGNYEYIAVAEPQGRGAWHLHCIFIFPEKNAPFMENSIIRDMWGNGFVNVRKLTGIDNIGLYFTAYLGDMEISEYIKATGKMTQVKAEDLKIIEDKEHKTKAIIKGGRLKLYPCGFNIYRISRGIKKPIKTVMENAEAEKMTEGYLKIYERTVKITDEGKGFSFLSNKKVYNKSLKRGGKNEQTKNADD